MRRNEFQARRARCGAALVVALLVAGATTIAGEAGRAPSAGGNASLYTGPGSRPGPDLLYEPVATAPQLTNTGIWKAPSDPHLRGVGLPQR